MIGWSQTGLSSLPTGDAKRLGLPGIFTISPPRRVAVYDREKGSETGETGWSLRLASREFSFVWNFGSKRRCYEYAEALVVAWGLESQVEGAPEPNPDDRHAAIAQRDMRFAMAYTPNVRKEYVAQ